MSMHDKKAIIVLGPPRSGTSLIGKILHQVGVDMGKIRPPDPENPTGYFEDWELLRLQDKIIEKCGHEYNGFNLPDFPDLLQNTQQVLPEIKKLIEKRQQTTQPLWGWKTSATCWSIPALIDYVYNPNIIVLLRHPKKIVDSQMRYTRNKSYLYEPITFENGMKLTFEYYNYIFQFLEDSCYPVCYLSYENLLDKPETELKRLLSFVNIEPPVSSDLKKCIHQPAMMKFKKIKKGIGLMTNQSYIKLLHDLCKKPVRTITGFLSLIQRN